MSKQKKDAEALSQVNKRTHDTFDPDDKNNVGSADPQDTSVYDDQHTYVAKAGSLVNTPPKKENVQTDVKIDEVTQSDADLAKAAAQWKKQKEEKTVNVTKTAVKAANTTVKANATENVQSKAQVKVEAKANSTTVEVKSANTTANATVKANTSAKANATDFIDPRPFPSPAPVALENAQHGASDAVVEKWKVDKEQKKLEEADKAPAAKVQVKSNSTDFNDPKPFPNPTPVPLAKAQKGDTPDKKPAEKANPEAAVQIKSSTKANVTQTAVKK